jgi:FkbM family methyltransferase
MTETCHASIAWKAWLSRLCGHLPRGRDRLQNLLASSIPSKGVLTTRLIHHRISIDLSDFVERMILLGQFEPEETHLFRSRVRAGMTIIDVGANVGYYTLLGSHLVGRRGRVLAYEPSPYAFHRLSRTLQTNRVSNVTLHQVALGPCRGTVQLNLPADPSVHDPSLINHASSGNFVHVAQHPLDDFLADIPVADLLKIDVEGYEKEVLAGAQQSLAAGKISAILCEFNDRLLRMAGSSSAELYQLLQSYGFRDTNPRPLGEFTNRLLIHQAAH